MQLEVDVAFMNKYALFVRTLDKSIIMVLNGAYRVHNNKIRSYGLEKGLLGTQRYIRSNGLERTQ